MVTFAVSFVSRAPAEVARSRLEAGRFTVELQEQPGGGLVVAATPEVEPSSAESVLTQMQALADDLGGDVLGYGGHASYSLRRIDS